jgi:hypothetical protein
MSEMIRMLLGDGNVYHQGEMTMRLMAARLLALLLFGSVLGGCVSAPTHQSFNRTEHQITNIVVLPMRRSEPQVSMMNHPGQNFGLIGLLVTEADLASKSEKLRGHLIRANFDQGLILRESLGHALQQRGYTVAWPEHLIESYPKTPRDWTGERKTYRPMSNGQAQLDVNYSFIGYAAAGATRDAPYRPTVTVSVRLMSADGRSTLFSDIFSYNNLDTAPSRRDWVTIEADPRFSYPRFDDLEAADAQSAEGLRVAIETIAGKIAERL